MYTQLEQRGGGLAVVVLGGLALWALSRRPASGEPVEPRPMGVQLGGSVGAVQVGQDALMGAHMLAKNAGEVIKVTVAWNADTRDQNTKLLLPWPYWLRIRFGHSTAVGWKDATELGFPTGGTNNSFSMPVTGPQSVLTQFVTPNDPNQAWDVHVQLYARNAIPGTNTPTTDTTKWTLLTPEPVKHDGAVVSWSPGAQLGGSVGSIQVAQRHPGRLVGLGRRQ